LGHLSQPLTRLRQGFGEVYAPLKSQHEACMNNTEKLSAKISGGLTNCG